MSGLRKIGIFAAAAVAAISALFIVFFVSLYPEELHDKSAVQSAVITDRNGVPLRDILSDNGGRMRWISLGEMSPSLINAVLTAEDRRFFYHPGVDPIAIIRAFYSNIRAGRVVSGGSTITQQLVRIVRPRRRGISSKVIEALTAVRIEMTMSKKEILEQYLNRAPFGNQLFGVEAASTMYFGKPAKDLSLSESAFLSILPRAPGAYNPYRNRVAKLSPPEEGKLRGGMITPYLRQAAGYSRLNRSRVEELYKGVLKRMYESKKIERVQWEMALNAPPLFVGRRWSFHAPHFVDMIGNLPEGKTVRTSLDISLQEEVERIIRSNLAVLKNYNVSNAAAVVIDNLKAEVIALVGSVDYFNPLLSGNVNGATAMRQPGSALKPFTYALALESGFTTSSVIPDVEMGFKAAEGEYVPKNYDMKFRGPVRIRTALANSFNVPAVYLLSLLGTDRLLIKLRELGFENLTEDSDYYGLGLTLGNGEVSLFELAAAYSALARGGEYVKPSLLAAARLPKVRKVFKRETAYIISDILSDSGARRMIFGEDSPLKLPFKVAVKTGTSKNFRDNWTVGYTPEYTVGVWVGNFDGSPMEGISGVTGAGPIFKDIFLALSKRAPLTWYAEPENIVHRSICPLSGQLPGSDCPPAVDEIFAFDAPTETCSFHVSRTIDVRNGLLAGKGCGEPYTRKVNFVSLPPIYHDWADKHGIKDIPRGYSPLCLAEDGMDQATAGNNASRRGVRITHPVNNTVYMIDLYTPMRFQTLYLRADSSGPVVWSIDGIPYKEAEEGEAVPWTISEGRHTISATSKDGEFSDLIEIEVK